MNVLSDPALARWLPPIVLIFILVIGWLLHAFTGDEPAPPAPPPHAESVHAEPAHGEPAHGEPAHGEPAPGAPAPAHH